MNFLVNSYSALVEHYDVMEEMELGPNGGLIFCMEMLLAMVLILRVEKKYTNSNQLNLRSGKNVSFEV